MADYKTDGLTTAQRNFLLRHAGDRLTQDKAQRYLDGHHKAVTAGLEVDSKPYFKTIADHVDRGSQPARREPSAQPRPRYDGASTPMPKLRGQKDEFLALRKAATNNGRHGRKE